MVKQLLTVVNHATCDGLLLNHSPANDVFCIGLPLHAWNGTP